MHCAFSFLFFLFVLAECRGWNEVREEAALGFGGNARNISVFTKNESSALLLRLSLFVIQIFHSAFWSHCTVRWLQGVCWSMWVCEGGWRDCYVVFNSLMACGKKLLWNLLWALVRQHFFSVSWMRGCELPSTAVLKYSIATTEPQAWL